MMKTSFIKIFFVYYVEYTKHDAKQHDVFERKEYFSLDDHEKK